jgi:hypothetical protein
MKSAAILVVAVLLAGCGGLRSLPPDGLPAAGEVVVLVDHFHSVVILPGEAMRPETRGPVPFSRLVAVHFGEERWLTDPEVGAGHGCILAVAGGPGMVVMNPLPRVDPTVMAMDPRRTRSWRFPISADGLAAMDARLRTTWLGGRVMELPDVDAYLVASPRPWTLGKNCHDFTVDLLRVGGLDLPAMPIVQAPGLAYRLDSAVAGLRRAGISVIGPPAPPSATAAGRRQERH